MKIAYLSLVCLLLYGCGTTATTAVAPTAVERAVDEKVFAALEHRLDMALQSGKDPGQVWANYADLYMKQADKSPDNAMFYKRKATSAYIIAAQYGNDGAREVLRKNDIPVPEAIFKN